MGDTAFGILIMGTIFVVMGGVGLTYAWPDLKRIGRKHAHRHP